MRTERRWTRSVILLAFPGVVWAGSATWNVDADGNWSAVGSWTAGGPPNGVNEVAALTNNISARRQVTVDQNVTLGTLLLGDRAFSYFAFRLLSSGGSVFTMDVSSGSALIGKYYPSGTAGNVVNDTNAVRIILQDHLIVSNASGGHLVMASNIFGAGYNLRVDGPGITNAGRVIFQSSNAFASVTIGQASFIASNAFAAGGATVTVQPGGTFFAGVSGITNPLIVSGHGFDQGGVGTIGSNGAIRLAHGVTLDSPITLVGDTRLVAYQGSGTVAGVISGPHNVFVGFTGHPTVGTNSAANRLTFAANNTYDGWTYIEPHAELRLGNNTVAGWVGTGPITNLGTLTFHRSDAVLVTNWIAGDGRIQHLGSGALTITQEVISAKYFFVNGTGPLVVGSDGALGTGTVEFGNAAAIIRSADATGRVLTNGLFLTTGFIADGPAAITFLGDVNNGALSKTIIVSNSLLHFAGALTNVGQMLKRGPGELRFGSSVAVSSFTNLEGMVRLGAGGVFTNANVAITLHPGAVLDVSAATNAFALGPLTILRGSGSIVGDASASGQVVPGLAVGTLTFSNNAAFSNAVVPFELRSAGTPGGGINDLIEVLGDLTLSGVSTVQVAAVGGRLDNAYTLISYGGTLSGGAANLFVIPDPTLRPGYTFAFDDATPGVIALQKLSDASATLTWAASTNAWDLMGAQSWQGPDFFYTGDRVQFTDAGAESNVVTIVGNLLPGEVLVSSASNYTFTGTGQIGYGHRPNRRRRETGQRRNRRVVAGNYERIHRRHGGSRGRAETRNGSCSAEQFAGRRHQHRRV